MRQMNPSLCEGGIDVGLLGIWCQWSVTAGVLYTDGENAGKQKEGKKKDRVHDRDETSRLGGMFATSFQLAT